MHAHTMTLEQVNLISCFHFGLIVGMWRINILTCWYRQGKYQSSESLQAQAERQVLGQTLADMELLLMGGTTNVWEFKETLWNELY